MKLNLSFLALFLPGISYAQTDGMLVQPSVYSSDNSGSLTIPLDMAEGQHPTVAASTFNTRLLGGSLPGPTVRIKAGDWLYVDFNNNLQPQNGINTGTNEFSFPDATNLHFHGGHVSGEAPGDDTRLSIDAQESYNYEVFFPQFHMGGTHWIHPHRHGSGTLQVGGGAAMVMIVDDAPNEVPPEVANAEEVIMMFQHFNVRTLEGAASDSGDDLFEINSNVGNDFRLVNGQYNPTHQITAGEWQRWRIVFGAWDATPLDLRIETGGVCEVHLLAKDGIYINDYPRTTNHYPVSTAGRADLMIRCSAAGQWPLTDFGGNVMTLQSVNPPGGPGAIDVSVPPTIGWNFPIPSYLADLEAENRQPTNGCACSTQLSRNAVNGLQYSTGSFVHTVAQGSTVERVLQGLNNHPYHQHVYPFQIQEINGNVNAEDALYHQVGDYHDTLMVRSAGNIRVMYQADNFLGRMAVHCHRLDHSDQGMLSAEDVVDPARGGVCECNAVDYSREPTEAPAQPTPVPTPEPTPQPTPQPTPAPVAPTPSPTDAPTPEPTPQPTPAPVAPTPSPTDAPNPEPTPRPTPAPVVPTPNPTSAPNPEPTPRPTPAPVAPTPNPTSAPTPAPTPEPTEAPVAPTPAPTSEPTLPVANPTRTPRPTRAPKTARPSRSPKTARPSRNPKTASPTRGPAATGACRDSDDLCYNGSCNRDCNWVGIRTTPRCGRGWEGQTLADFCPETCGQC